MPTKTKAKEVAGPRPKPLYPELYQYATVREIRSAILNLQKTKTLLGDKSRWIKGDYDDVATDEEGRDLHYAQYCLIGAQHHVDGAGELLANSILQNICRPDKNGYAYIPYELHPDNNDNTEHDPDEPDFVDFEKRFCTAHPDIYCIASIQDYTDGVHAESFNDNVDTTFRDIHRLLDFAIKQAEKLIVYLQKQKAAKKKRK